MVTIPFYFATLAVMPFWIAMILAPSSPRTHRLVASPWIVLVPALGYLGLAVPHARELVAIFFPPSPESLAAVMAAPWAAGIHWTHAATFDLFVGRWMFLDARRRGIRQLWMSPVLAVSLLLGPLGYALYAIVCAIHRREERAVTQEGVAIRSVAVR